MRRLVLAGLCTIGCAIGCAATPVKAGPPVSLLVPEKENPDVIWVVRAVDIPVTGEPVGPTGQQNTRGIYGLFACYRAPASAPAPPKCYLTQYSWRPEDLNWPGRAEIRDGELIILPPTPPAPAASDAPPTK